MIRLVLDTSSTRICVAVVVDDTTLVSISEQAGQRQGESLAPLLQRVLAESEVRAPDQVVVGVGPGPFTGLRVGVVTAAVLARVWDVPLVGVCSLDGYARRALRDVPGEQVAVVADARRREVYWAQYDHTGDRTGGPHVDMPDVAAQAIAGLRTVGHGALLYGEAFAAAGCLVAGPEFLDAADLALALNERPEVELPPLPLYLRRPDAAEPGPRKRVGT